MDLRARLRRVQKETTDSFERFALGQAARILGKEMKGDWSMISKVMEAYLVRERIRPEFLMSKDPNFASMREALATDPGVVISNHPAGYIDVPITFSMIPRSDILVYTNKRVKEGLVLGAKKYLGENARKILDDHLLTNDPKKAIENYRKALDHVTSGGVLILHPTAGKERKANTKVVQFEPGFRLLLRKLESDCMVYAINYDLGHSFYKNPMFFTGRAASLEIPSSVARGQLEGLNVQVKEVLTRAADWSSRWDTDEQTTGKYWSLFDETRDEVE